MHTSPHGSGQRVLAACLLAVLAAAGTAQDESAPELPEGPTWGRSGSRPQAANVLFATSDGCALCHSASPLATAMRSRTGGDVSPFGLWQASLMANAFRDPFWRAQVAYEGLTTPDRKVDVEALCLRCHGPMAHHTARVAKTDPPSVAAAAEDPLAVDGVSCTVCHQARPDDLGRNSSFGGNLDIRPGRTIFGPYPEPFDRPMRMHAAYTPTEGAHIRDAALCGSCHTLETSPGEGHGAFLEQAPFLEWRNSVFSGEPGAGGDARTCQECHMPDIGAMRIARNPGGRDFPRLDRRPDVRAHSFVGGNAYMLRLLRENAEELGVIAPPAALSAMEYASRRLLGEDTARLRIGKPQRRGDRLAFSITVENLTGHKLPTGYPSRRMWLRVQVRDGERPIWSSGDHDPRGKLRGIRDERSLPHVEVVRSAGQVVVYEAVPLDVEGKPTTLLHRMAKMGKDNRLLPRGWKADGPHADRTAPVGVGEDADFTAGADTVAFDVRLPRGAPGEGLVVMAWLLYQPVPPAWIEPLRTADAPEARRFVEMVDASPPVPETLALATRAEGE